MTCHAPLFRSISSFMIVDGTGVDVTSSRAVKRIRYSESLQAVLPPQWSAMYTSTDPDDSPDYEPVRSLLQWPATTLELRPQRRQRLGDDVNPPFRVTAH